MKNYVAPGNTVTVTSSTIAKSGDLIMVGSIAGVCATDAAVGQAAEVSVEGMFDLKKIPADSFAPGAVVQVDANGTVVTAGTTAVGWGDPERWTVPDYSPRAAGSWDLKSENRSIHRGCGLPAMVRSNRPPDSITAQALKSFLCRICATVDRDGLLIVRDPVMCAEVSVPARLLCICARRSP
jgi:predicted RecA/RadA family phage recombinase